jgi:hypothetical protein
MFPITNASEDNPGQPIRFVIAEHVDAEQHHRETKKGT